MQQKIRCSGKSSDVIRTSRNLWLNLFYPGPHRHPGVILSAPSLPLIFQAGQPTIFTHKLCCEDTIQSLRRADREFNIGRPATTDDILLDNLSYKEVFRYSKTCKVAHQKVASYIRRKHKLETVLGKYFTTDQILDFRHLQAMTGMIISGSTALQFFERVLYPESDLDLYVEHRYMQPIALWLASIGYIYIPTNNSEQNGVGNGANSPSATYSTLEEVLDVAAPERPAYPVIGHYPRIFFRCINQGYINTISFLNFMNIVRSKSPHPRVPLLK